MEDSSMTERVSDEQLAQMISRFPRIIAGYGDLMPPHEWLVSALNELQSLRSAVSQPVKVGDVMEQSDLSQRAEEACRASDLTSEEWMQAYLDETARIDRRFAALPYEGEAK